MRRSTPPAIACAMLVMSSMSAAAQVSLGAGVAMVPQFEGSKEFDVRVAPSFSFQNDRFSARSSGPGIAVDVLPSRAVDAGPVLRYNFGRNSGDIDNAQVRALPSVAGGIELGGYAQLNIPVGGFQTFVAPRVAVLQGVEGGARGTVAEASLGITRLQGKWVLGARAETTYASADYMNDRFGVSAGSPSGLAAFTADAGIKDAGISLFANYKLSESVSLTGVAGYKVLMGDAASSPIVNVAGSKIQTFITLGVSYTFN